MDLDLKSFWIGIAPANVGFITGTIVILKLFRFI